MTGCLETSWTLYIMLLLVVVHHTYGMVYLGIYIDCSVRRAMFSMVLDPKDDINGLLDCVHVNPHQSSSFDHN